MRALDVSWTKIDTSLKAQVVDVSQVDASLRPATAAPGLTIPANRESKDVAAPVSHETLDNEQAASLAQRDAGTGAWRTLCGSIFSQALLLSRRSPQSIAVPVGSSLSSYTFQVSFLRSASFKNTSNLLTCYQTGQIILGWECSALLFRSSVHLS